MICDVVSEQSQNFFDSLDGGVNIISTRLAAFLLAIFVLGWLKMNLNH